METKNTVSLSNHKVKFKVSLSNGETFYEGKGYFKEFEGEKSPWQKLIQYTIENRLEITSLSLYTDGGKTFNLPSAGKNPKFKHFNDIPNPIDYNIMRSIAREVKVSSKDKGFVLEREVEISEWFTIAEAIYSDYKLQLWVDELNNKNCWVLCVPHKI